VREGRALWFGSGMSPRGSCIKCLAFGASVFGMGVGVTFRGDWRMRALTSSMTLFIEEFLAEWAIRRWGLVGESRSLWVCL
jgi:hypothetical protein